MEENKKEGEKCCNSSESCEQCKAGSCCGHKCCSHKCHGGLFKIFIVIVLIAAAFYAGCMMGERGDFRDRFEGRKFMSNKVYGPKTESPNTATDSVIINVTPSTESTETNNPPVLE